MAITGLILAGGQGRRMGGVDKGLLLLGHRTLTAHVIERLRPQVGALLINANRHLPRYAAFGYPVIPDSFSVASAQAQLPLPPRGEGHPDKPPSVSNGHPLSKGGTAGADHLPLSRLRERVAERPEEGGIKRPPLQGVRGKYPGPLAGLHAGLSEARTPWVVTAPCDSPMLPRDLVARLYVAAQQHDAPLAVAKTGDRLHPVFALAHRRVLPDLTAYLQDGERKVALWFARIGGVEVSFDDQPDAFRNINTQDELDAIASFLAS